MASANKKLPEFMIWPERDSCMARLLSAAHELETAGYKHRTIAEAALNVALQHALEGGSEDYRLFLRVIARIGRETLADIERLADAHAKAGELTAN